LFLVCSYAFLAADLAHLLEQGLTLGAAGFLLALLLAPIGALLAAISYSTRIERHAMVVLYVACLVALAVLTLRMSRPIEAPVREVANVIYLDQRDTAYWLVDRPRSQLVTGLRDHGFQSGSDQMSLNGMYPQASIAPAPVNLIEARASVEVATADSGWRIISIVLEPAPVQTLVRLSLPPGARCEKFTINDGQLSAPVAVRHAPGSQITLYGRYDARIGLEINCHTGAGRQYAVVEEVASQPGFQQAAWWAEFERAYRSQNRGTRSTLRSSVLL
jgi:hypothetical protein